MQIESEYLDSFAVEPLEPTEIPLNDWEMFAGAGTVTLDDAERRSLIVMHWDEWPSLRDAIAAGRTDKRWTFVTLQKDGATIGPVGYEFPGLVKLDDLRDWFRTKLGVAEAA